MKPSACSPESATIGRSFAAVMCDGDKFKSVNDTHGHHVGDAVLRELASRIAAAARFLGRSLPLRRRVAAISPEPHSPGRCHRRTGAGPFRYPSSICRRHPARPSLPITISLGVACNDPAGAGAFASLTGVIEAADKALYRKHAGRNRVAVLHLSRIYQPNRRDARRGTLPTRRSTGQEPFPAWLSPPRRPASPAGPARSTAWRMTRWPHA